MTKVFQRVFLAAMVFLWIVIGILTFKSTRALTVANAEEASPVYYPAAGYVVNVDSARDYFLVKTNDGNIWQISGSEDWMVGDLCIMVMLDNGTPGNICDDTVVSARYFVP